MTVRELKKCLSKLDPEKQVVVGFAGVNSSGSIPIVDAMDVSILTDRSNPSNQLHLIVDLNDLRSSVKKERQRGAENKE